MGPRLWNRDEERAFFGKTLEIATPEQLFYLTDDGRFLAYWPKKYKGKKTTLQSRNAFIGSYTEKWVKDIIIGNTPITKTYYRKVDFLKKAGIIQGFYSVNPDPLDGTNGNNIKSTQYGGFLRVDVVEELYDSIRTLVSEKNEFFSSMISKAELGRLIEIADEEPTYEKKAERFLTLLRGI